MRRSVVLFVMMFLGTLLFASSEQWEQGIEAFKNGEFEVAVSAWEKIKPEDRNAHCWYNLGNGYFKLKRLGEARWSFEKALLLDPSLTDAQFNLDLVKSRLVDVVEESPYVGIRTSFQSFLLSLGSGKWSLITLLLAFSGTVFWLLYWLSNRSRVRRFGIYGGVLSSILVIFAFSAAISSYNLEHESEFGIVLSKKVDVFHAPELGSSKAFVLHEGTKVEVNKIVGSWQEIALSNGQSGWIEGKHIIRL